MIKNMHTTCYQNVHILVMVEVKNIQHTIKTFRNYFHITFLENLAVKVRHYNYNSKSIMLHAEQATYESTNRI